VPPLITNTINACHRIGQFQITQGNCLLLGHGVNIAERDVSEWQMIG